MFSNQRALTIEWGDCDPAGIVFYPRYFQMFDASTAALFEAAAGCTKYEMMRRYDFAGFPMIDTGARFHIPSKFGDRVLIESRMIRIGKSSFDIEHRLMRDSSVAIEAHEKRVWVGRDPDDPERIRSRPIPQDLVQRLHTAN